MLTTSNILISVADTGQPGRTFIVGQVVGGGHVADAGVVGRRERMKVDRLALDGLVLLVERLEDEDDGDQHGEAFLGESRDVAHQSAQVERHHDEKVQRQPHPDPETQLQIVEILAPGQTSERQETDISCDDAITVHLYHRNDRQNNTK